MKQVSRGECDLKDLIPAPYNPRKISDEQMNGLQKSLDRWGLVQEIVVNKRTNHIVGGHQRASALEVNGEKKAAVVWVDIDEDEERALNVALNSPHISGEFDFEKLPPLLDEIELKLPEVFDDLRLERLREEAFEGSPGKELDLDSFDDSMELKFSFSSDLYYQVMGKLREIDDDERKALMMALGVECA